MNTKTTWGLCIAALLMFLYIVFIEHGRFGVSRDKVVPELLPEFNANNIENVQVTISNTTFAVQKSSDGWRLSKPSYPAQATPIQSLLLKVDELRILDVISAQEVKAQGGLKVFELEPPRATVVFQGGGQSYSLNIGKATALTNQIYLQVAGSPDVVVADGAIAAYVPATPGVWRNPMLLQFENLTFDTISIRSGSRVFEVEHDSTNNLWHITKPMPARADQDRIAALLQNLRTARIAGFIGDASGKDLEKLGLQAPEVSLSFLKGTNVLSTVEFGNTPTNNPSLIVARKVAENALVMADQRITESLKQPYKTFHESRLLSLKMDAVDRIEVKASEAFSLNRKGNRWEIQGSFEGVADPELMQDFLTNLASLEIVDFAKDVPTDVDLKNYHLSPPLFSYGLFKSQTNLVGLLTNHLITSVEFGTNQLDVIHVRRSDETPVYLTRYADVLVLPKRAFELRNRRLFTLDQTNITAIEFSAEGKMGRIARNQTAVWTSDAVLNANIAENVFRFANMQVVSWVSKGEARMRLYGINESSPKLLVEMVQGDKVERIEISLGNRTPSGNYYAATHLTDVKERVVFEFSGGLLADLLTLFAAPR